MQKGHVFLPTTSFAREISEVPVTRASALSKVKLQRGEILDVEDSLTESGSFRLDSRHALTRSWKCQLHVKVHLSSVQLRLDHIAAL